MHYSKRKILFTSSAFCGTMALSIMIFGLDRGPDSAFRVPGQCFLAAESANQRGKYQVKKMIKELAFNKCLTGLTILCCCMIPGLAVTRGTVFAQEDLSVLKSWRIYSDARSALYNKIAGEAFLYLSRRDSTLEEIRIKEEWFDYIAAARAKLAEAFGPLPERTPLKARITGKFDYQGVRVERIIYESRPGFWVTSCLFKPVKHEGRLPVILYLCGHSVDGFRSEPYQRVLFNLASKGFAAFTIDPVGQGERLQYYDQAKGGSAVGGPTLEHSYAGLQYLLLGRTMAMVRLWDCLRAVDYLITRPDIDPQKIGVHGRSGGGTMSAYLGAMDSRIAAAAPECYITSFRRLFQSIGPQDAEQNLLSQVSTGLDHGDFLIVRAPRPTLVITTTRDFFSIQGARETVSLSGRAFSALGKEQNLGIIEDDAPHMSTKANRERMYAFFMECFGVKGSTADQDFKPPEPSLLQVSPTGQVVTSGSKTIYDCIVEDAAAILGELNKSRESISAHREKVQKGVEALSGLRIEKKATEAVFAGKFQRRNCAIEKVILSRQNDIPLPALVFVPRGDGPHPGIIYLDQKGKGAAADSGGLLESLASQGFLVLAPDLPGCGELAGDTVNDDAVIKGISYNFIFGTQLIGRSVTGIQAGYIIDALHYMGSRKDVAEGRIFAVSRGNLGPALMHAASQDTTVKALAFIESPLSWESILQHRFYDQSIGATIVPKALKYYDLPDLLGLISPRRVLVVDPFDGDGRPLPDNLRRKFTTALEPYYNQIPERLVITNSGEDNLMADILIRWLKENI